MSLYRSFHMSFHISFCVLFAPGVVGKDHGQFIDSFGDFTHTGNHHETFTQTSIKPQLYMYSISSQRLSHCGSVFTGSGPICRCSALVIALITSFYYLTEHASKEKDLVV